MHTLTKAQLVKVMIEYYKRAENSPQDFYEAADPIEDAVNAVELMFEIATQQNQGVYQ